MLAFDGLLPGAKFGRSWIFVRSQILAHVTAECAKNLGRAKAQPEPVDGIVTAQSSTRERVLQQPPGRRLPMTPTPPKRSRGRPRNPIPSFG